MSRASALLEEWCLAQTIRASPSQRNRTPAAGSSTEWSPPPASYVKINIAAASPTLQLTGIGMCIHDARGQLLQARTSWFEPQLAVREGEAIGLLRALQWVVELNLQNVLFELDAKQVVDSLSSRVIDLSEIGSVIFECKRLLSLNPTFGVGYVRRQANVVAHSLARVATFWSRPQVF